MCSEMLLFIVTDYSVNSWILPRRDLTLVSWRELVQNLQQAVVIEIKEQFFCIHQ